MKKFFLSYISRLRQFDDTKNELLSESSSLASILLKLVREHSIVIVLIVYFINLFNNPNIITLIPNITLLIFVIVRNPFPDRKYINLLFIYAIAVVSLKMIYQLPIFCSSIAFTFSFSNSCESYNVNEYFFY